MLFDGKLQLNDDDGEEKCNLRKRSFSQPGDTKKAEGVFSVSFSPVIPTEEVIIRGIGFYNGLN